MSLRQIERDGVSDFLERAFTGFTQISENAGPSNQAWWMILEVSENCTLWEADKAWKRLCQEHHPDKGGDADYIYLLNDAHKREARFI